MPAEWWDTETDGRFEVGTIQVHTYYEDEVTPNHLSFESFEVWLTNATSLFASFSLVIGTLVIFN